MLIAFADESQTNEKVPIIAVGGGLGTGLQWCKLSKAWQQALKTEPDVENFHAKDFESPEGRIGKVYENWELTRRNSFNQKLTDAITHNQIAVCTVATVKPSDFNEVIAARKKKLPKALNAFYFCAYKFIEQNMWWANQYFPNQGIIYYFEQGGLHQKGIEMSYNHIKNNEEMKQLFKFAKSPVFAPKDVHLELQIADKLVYEAAKHSSHHFDNAPDAKYSMISPVTGENIWKTRYSPNQWVRGGLEMNVRLYRKHEIEETFDEWNF